MAGEALLRSAHLEVASQMPQGEFLNSKNRLPHKLRWAPAYSSKSYSLISRESSHTAHSSNQIDNELLQEINCIVFSLKEKHYLYDYPVFP